MSCCFLLNMMLKWWKSSLLLRVELFESILLQNFEMREVLIVNTKPFNKYTSYFKTSCNNFKNRQKVSRLFSQMHLTSLPIQVKSVRHPVRVLTAFTSAINQASVILPAALRHLRLPGGWFRQSAGLLTTPHNTAAPRCSNLQTVTMF